ncbi:ubiquinone biosynthesis protein [Dysgonomonas sp. PFB1-18]|uniref:ABC1 kinase family protein n=1 Tax=unclassified Dysgonomonas TaxID=2630389 RepID=UPI00247349D1|nr:MULTISPECIES: AarF/UbiB family protein [unclassified Dysgonomonas]MDH6309872.1 ubiquinone biosynthesis protein [Dysgonomonas sp. PF1-14]MDH6339416.1 ubiquinone biosynthesis protein [Dysgonomonas sp. PF1-16]MDH6380915.1 ubiquinone biosynthesis protein [Dysgonomonas sp. PFB1-18]MDH6397924.1 ubiquinone biosynthesis protein [Dysgonomonas sp. PF1-23]
MDNLKKIKRTAQLAAVLTKYGFEALVTETNIKKLIPDSYIEKSEKRKEIFAMNIYERIRMVLEELGPAYIKLGQLLSNRDDLLPEELTVELQKLQDNVTIKDINIYETVAEELLVDTDEIFEYIDQEPIAAASLSQVYTGRLRTGQKVIIKVKKKGIREIFEADVLIMKDFAHLLEKYYELARKVGMSRIVSTFEKSVTAELSFTQELANIERFRSNFEGDDTIYIPTTYKELSNSNILCMEFIDGIKISDRDKIQEAGLDTKNIASSVVNLYLKQIIDFGLFHADPHSGNLFVLTTGQIAFIDYGSVGKMLPHDKENLGDFIIYGLRKDVKRLVRIIKKVAVKCNISNEEQFQRDLYDFLDILESTSIKELDLNDITKKFSKMLNENEVVLPDYIYLLIRGIVLLEGTGRELGLEEDIIENIRPYGIKLIKSRLNPKHLTNKVIDKLYNLGDKLEELPEDAHALIQKMNNNELEVNHNLKGLHDIRNTINLLVIALIISSLAIGSSILVLADMPPKLWGVSVFGFLGFTISGIMAIIIILIIIKNKMID